MSAPRPLVSVILPTYNRAKLLERAMKSVLAQTYPELELIVCDDCSPDNTQAVVKAFADPRVRYLRMERNARAAAARNAGIRAARGTLVAFQDDDDMWLPEKLERQVAALLAAPPEVGLNLASYVRLLPHGSLYVGGTDAFRRMDFSRGYYAFVYGLIATPGWLVRRECLERAGLFDEGMRAWDDWELALRLSDVCRFSHLDEPLYLQDYQRVAGGGMIGNRPNLTGDLKILATKHAERWRKRSPAVLAHHLALWGASELAHHSVPEGRRILWQAVRTSPPQFKALALLALSYIGKSWVDRAKAAAQSLRRILRRTPAKTS